MRARRRTTVRLSDRTSHERLVGRRGDDCFAPAKRACSRSLGAAIENRPTRKSAPTRSGRPLRQAKATVLRASRRRVCVVNGSGRLTQLSARRGSVAAPEQVAPRTCLEHLVDVRHACHPPSVHHNARPCHEGRLCRLSAQPATGGGRGEGPALPPLGLPSRISRICLADI